MRADFTEDVVISNGVHVDARAYGATLSNTTIDAAITAIGADYKDLVISPGTWTISGNLTIPANVRLIVTEGVTLSVSLGFTLTILSEVSAGLYKIFNGDGTVDLNNMPGSVYPEWFGAHNDETEATITRQAIQAALDSISTNGGTVQLSNGTYLVDGALTGGHYYSLEIPSNTSLVGVGVGSVIKGTLTPNGSIQLIKNSGSLYCNSLPDPFTPIVADRNSNISVRDIHFDVVANMLGFILSISNLDRFEMSGCSSDNIGNLTSTGMGVANIWGAASDILICNNKFRGRFGIWLRPLGMDAATDEISNVNISNNTIEGYRDELIACIGFSGVIHDVVIKGNVTTFLDDYGSGEPIKIVGYDALRAPGAAGNQQVYNISIIGNTIIMDPAVVGSGIVIVSEPTGLTHIFDNFSIIGNTISGGMNGIYATAGSNIAITDNVLRDSVLTRDTFPYGAAIAGITPAMIVSGNLVENWTADADGASIFVRGTISNNMISNSLTSHGIQVYADSIAIGNVVTGCARSGIFSSSGSRAIIIGNRTDSNGASGIRGYKLKQSVIIGNYCTANIGTGISIEHADSVDNVIAFNMLYNNGTDVTVIATGTENLLLGNIIGTAMVNLDPTLIKTFTANDATPSVANGSTFVTANTGGGVTITTFDDGFIGQEIRVIIGDAVTIVDFTGTNLKGNAAGDWSPNATDHMTCVFDGTNWYCDISNNT